MADVQSGQQGGGSEPLTLADLRVRLGRFDTFAAAVAVIIVAQAAWFATLMHRGWYYQVDFYNLAYATGRSPGWAYLTQPQGGHLDPVGRIVLWLLNRTVPLNYGATIVLRLLAQAGVTFLAGRLLSELVGRRRGVLGLLTLFAFSPLAVQSTLWLTSSINFLISELFLIVALRCFLRYAVTGKFSWLLKTSAAVFAATLASEQAAITVVALPILSFAFLTKGTPRRRLRTLLGAWRSWAVIAAPVIAFAVYFRASGRYAKTNPGYGAGQAVRLAGHFLVDTVIPGMLGGPFAWSSLNGNYLANAAAPGFIRLGAVLLLLLLIVWTAFRTSLRALWAWSIPLVVSTLGIAAVGGERAGLYGPYGVEHHFEYAAYTALPAMLGAALAIWSTSVEDLRARLERSGTPPAPLLASTSRSTREPQAALALVTVVACFSLVSASTYTHHWSQSPSRSYVRTLSAALNQAGSGVTVLDTFLPPQVMAGLLVHPHESDLLHLMGAHIHLNNGPTQPVLIDDTGHLVRESFLNAAAVVLPTKDKFCNDLLTGQRESTKQLASIPRSNDWFVRLLYFQSTTNTVEVVARTASGKVVVPVGGSRVVLTGREGQLIVRLPTAQPASISVTGVQSTTNVCFTSLAVGYPFPAK